MFGEIHENPEQIRTEERETVKNIRCEENISLAEAIKILQFQYMEMEANGAEI